jgi:hypothetical protein
MVRLVKLGNDQDQICRRHARLNISVAAGQWRRFLLPSELVKESPTQRRHYALQRSIAVLDSYPRENLRRQWSAEDVPRADELPDYVLIEGEYRVYYVSFTDNPR